MGGWTIGVDLGGTHIRAVASDPDGRWPGGVQTAATPAGAGVDALLRAVGDGVAAAAAAAGLDPSAVAAVAVGAPGPVDRQGGVLLSAPNLGPGPYPIGPYLQQRFGVPAGIENDANAAALGEHGSGAGRGAAHLIYLGVGTGIGGGIVSDGRLYVGTGTAGELGHMVIDVNGPRCGCGAAGCLEAMASGTAIARMGREAAAREGGQALLTLAGGNPAAISAPVVARAAEAGDAAARNILVRAATALGTGVAAFINIFAPQRVVLGGGVVTGLGPAWVEQVAATARRTAMAPARDRAAVVTAGLGDAAGLHGALAVAAALAAGTGQTD